MRVQAAIGRTPYKLSIITRNIKLGLQPLRDLRILAQTSPSEIRTLCSHFSPSHQLSPSHSNTTTNCTLISLWEDLYRNKQQNLQATYK